MFQGRIETMPIPERVFELCKITAESPAPLADIREKLEPSQMTDSATAYFGSILTAAKELKLIEQTEDDKLIYCGDRKMLQKISSFRRYCNSVVFQDQSTTFYQIAVRFLDSNLEWLRFSSLTSEDVMDDLRKNTAIEKVIQDDLRGIRFWMSFLGFGLIFEKGSIVFLPNMYTALKDFLSMAKLEKKHEYTMSEFCEALMPYAHVALHGVAESHTLNYAMSAALRMMNDAKEIELRRNPDSQEVWNLYPQEDHAFISEVTHIVLLKEVL